MTVNKAHLSSAITNVQIDLRPLILFVVLIFSLLIPTESFARLYKWIDENGEVHISDQKPPLTEEELEKRSLKNIRNSSEYDFRKTKWGFSKPEVLESEEIQNFKSNSDYTDFDEQITAVTSVFGKECVLIYEFLENKLVLAGYCFLGDGKRGDVMGADFFHFENQFIKEFGKPNVEEIDGLPYKAVWETDSSEIRIIYRKNPIPGVDYHCCDIELKSKELQPIMERRYTENKAKQQKQFEEMFAESQRKKMSTSESDSDFSTAKYAIRADCEKKWQDNFRMQEHCIKEQEEAIASLSRGGPKDIPEVVFTKIRSQCKLKWGNNFRMRKYCEDEQCSSWRRLGH